MTEFPTSPSVEAKVSRWVLKPATVGQTADVNFCTCCTMRRHESWPSWLAGRAPLSLYSVHPDGHCAWVPRMSVIAATTARVNRRIGTGTGTRLPLALWFELCADFIVVGVCETVLAPRAGYFLVGYSRHFRTKARPVSTCAGTSVGLLFGKCKAGRCRKYNVVRGGSGLVRFARVSSNPHSRARRKSTVSTCETRCVVRPPRLVTEPLSSAVRDAGNEWS